MRSGVSMKSYWTGAGWLKNIRIDESVFILVAFALLLIPLPWFVAAILAGIVHELCHAAAIILLDGRILDIQIGWKGTKMETDIVSDKKEIIAALSGPAGSFSLLLLAKIIPRTAFCGTIHGLYNMFPVYPLDGGRCVRCILRFFLSESQIDKVEKRIRRILFFFLFTMLFMLKLGILLALPLLISIAEHNIEKFLAKRTN